MKPQDGKDSKLDPLFIEKKLRELATLEEMNKEIHATMNIQDLLQLLVEKAVIGVNFERGLIYLVDGEFLRCVAFLDRVKREKASTIRDWVGFRMDETAVEVQAVQQGETLYVKDAQTDARISEKFLKITDSKEYCVVPLVGRRQVLGVLTGDKFYSRKPILPEDIQTLELFAGHISLAVENAMLYEEKEGFARVLEKRVKERTAELALSNRKLSRRMKELSTLFEMSGLLGKSLKPDTVANHILSMVAQLGYPKCAVHLLDRTTSVAVYRMGLGGHYAGAGADLLDRVDLKSLSKNPAPFLLPDLQGVLADSGKADYFKKNKIRSALVLPLHSKDRVQALLNLYTSQKGGLDKDQKAFFSTFAQQAGAAVENALAFQSVVEQRDLMKNLSRKLEEENVTLREKIKTDLERKFVVGKSPAMKEVMELVGKVAPTDTTVLVYGETGTGKELIANAVHEMGVRKDGPLIKVNCAAIPEDLLESELFGHEKGAFTGALDRSVGMFRLAQKGTIFLDEVGDMSLKTQTKLLRVLQENEIQPLGAKAPVRVDVRVVAATNRDLKQRIDAGQFRSDLFYRLNVFPIFLPPLRKRKTDIPELVAFFLAKYRHLRPEARVDPDVMDVFMAYAWPGNIRELENIIERLMIVSKNDVITRQDLPWELGDRQAQGTSVKPLRDALLDFKRQLVEEALARSDGRKAEAAALLGMPRSNFSRLMKQLKLR